MTPEQTKKALNLYMQEMRNELRKRNHVSTFVADPENWEKLKEKINYQEPK